MLPLFHWSSEQHCLWVEKYHVIQETGKLSNKTLHRPLSILMLVNLDLCCLDLGFPAEVPNCEASNNYASSADSHYEARDQGGWAATSSAVACAVGCNNGHRYNNAAGIRDSICLHEQPTKQQNINLKITVRACAAVSEFDYLSDLDMQSWGFVRLEYGRCALTRLHCSLQFGRCNLFMSRDQTTIEQVKESGRLFDIS